MVCGYDLRFLRLGYYEILDENIEKLSKRYPKGFFTYQHARREGKRIDWNEKKK